MRRPSRLSLCVLALIALQIVAPFASAVELRVREHTLNRARLRADAQAATQTQTTTQSQSTTSASTQAQAKTTTNATAASTAHSQLEAQIESEVESLTRTIADASAAAGASVKQTLETLASIQGSAALTADLAAASERIVPDLDPLTTPLSQLLGGRPPPPPKAVELFIGDNSTISRLIMQSPPRDAFVWSNFNDGSFSLTVGPRHVMLFGKQKVPVKAPTGLPRITNTTVPTPPVPKAPVRFRSVPDHEETVKPHFMDAESRAEQMEANAPAPAAAAPAANSVLANFMAAQQRMQAAAQGDGATAATARQRMYDLAEGEDVESDSVDFAPAASEQAAAPAEAAPAHRFAAGSSDAEDPYADNPLLHGFFKHGDMGKSILSAIADDKSEDGEEAVDQAAAKEVDQWSHEIDGKTFVNDKDLEAADNDEGDLSFLELEETKRVARVSTRRSRSHITRHYSTAPGGPAGKPNATSKANSTKNGTASATPKPSPVSNITGEFRWREFLRLGNVTARGKLNITKHTPVLRGLPQFALVEHDDFDTHAAGWSDQSRQVCGDSEDFFLGGPCKFSDTRATKTFRLPPHRFVRVTARYHFFDKWEGEFGFLKLDNVTMWTQAHHHCPKVFHQLCKGISVCGDENTSDRLSTLIDVTIPHNIGTLSVSFDSSLSKRKHPCQASFGIDDVAVYAM